MSGVSSYNPQNIPSDFNTRVDADIQERRLHTIWRNLYALLEEFKAIDSDANPARISSGEAAAYQSSLTTCRTKVKELIQEMQTIEALIAP